MARARSKGRFTHLEEDEPEEARIVPRPPFFTSFFHRINTHLYIATNIIFVHIKQIL